MLLTTHVGGNHRVEAEGEHVVLVRGEGKLASLVNVLPADQMMASSVSHHQINLLSCYLVHLELSRHQDIFMDLLLETFPKRRRTLKLPETI